MKRDVAQAWIKALRSRDYQQGKSVLQYGDTYCCLGVLCSIAPKELVHKSLDTGQIYGETLSSQPKVMTWAEIKTAYGCLNGVYAPDSLSKVVDANYLTRLNDAGVSFEDIACLIEKNWETM